jgi:hypothetical protein
MKGYNRYIGWKPVGSSAKILQIYSKGLEYALISQEYEQCHPFVWCKDFLHDVVYGTINNKCIELYKFKYNPKIDPNPCLDKIRLIVANSKDRKFATKIPAVIDFLNQIETKLKIKQSFARECRFPPEGYEKNGVFMLEGSKRWIQSPPMLSLYTLLIRVGFCHTIGDHFTKTIEGIKTGQIKPYQKKDNHWLKNTEPALQKILRVGDRKIFYKDIQSNYPANMHIDSIHNRLGIIGFATDMLQKATGKPVLVPYWHYQK